MSTALRRPKIALLFGDWLVRGQIEAFQGLKNDFDLTLFTWKGVSRDEISLQTVDVRAIDHYLSNKNPFFRIANRALAKGFGSAYCPGLEKTLAGFDLIYTGEPYTSWTEQALQAKRASGARVVVQSYENLFFRREETARVRSIKTQCYAEADHFIAVTEQARDVMLAEGARPDAVTVVPPAVDTNFFRPKEQDGGVLEMLGSDAEHVTILFAGRLLWVKGILDLVEAAKIVQSSLHGEKKVRFVVVGSGADEELMRKHIKYHGVQDLIMMIKRIPHQKMPDVFNCADIFVAPSSISSLWEEQFGMVLVESMACSTPVISTTTGAIPEVTKGCAKLVPCKDPVALAAAIVELVKDPEYRKELGKRSQQLAQSSYSIPVVAPQLKAVFDKLLAQS